MHILICGGGLQGIEASMLAKKAGYEVTVLDKNVHAPGASLGQRFVQADVFDESAMLSVVGTADVILPALECREALEKISEYGKRTGTKIIFDKKAYDNSSSKKKSNQIFAEENIPMPKAYPFCGYPVILKPDGQSGSSHVHLAHSQAEVDAYLEKYSQEAPVIQEYLPGRSYSLEVIGDGKNYYYPQITEVEVDKMYDCKRIFAPAQLSLEEKEQMLCMGRKLAERMQIQGIFDIEAINHGGQLKILEIDARLPSQTPISVWHSTGVNMLEVLVHLAFGRTKEAENAAKPLRAQACMYQQIQVADKKIQVLGEHIMSDCQNLRQIEGFFGAEEAVTDYSDEGNDFKAIVIVVGKTPGEACEKFAEVIQNIKKQPGYEEYEFIEG